MSASVSSVRGVPRVLLGVHLLYGAILFCLPAAISALDWPRDTVVTLEFGDREQGPIPGEPSPVMSFQGGMQLSTIPINEVIFRGSLPNALGQIAVRASGEGLLEIYGNIDLPASGSDPGGPEVITLNTRLRPWEDGHEPLLLMILDTRENRIVNPELLLNSPDENRAPSVRRLRMYPVNPDGSLSAVYDHWSWYGRRSLPAGEYRVFIDWADGRFVWDDVDTIFSLVLAHNGQIKISQNLNYLEERDGLLEPAPGLGNLEEGVVISLQPGINSLSLVLHDAKGLSSRYEFTLNGIIPPDQEPGL